MFWPWTSGPVVQVYLASQSSGESFRLFVALYSLRLSLQNCSSFPRAYCTVPESNTDSIFISIPWSSPCVCHDYSHHLMRFIQNQNNPVPSESDSRVIAWLLRWPSENYRHSSCSTPLRRPPVPFHWLWRPTKWALAGQEFWKEHFSHLVSFSWSCLGACV